MNFAELITEVETLTKRPDLIAKTKQAIRAATLRVHSSGFYPFDIIETGIEWTEPRILQNFNPYDTWERYRRIKYLRRWDPPLSSGDQGMAGVFYTPVEIGNIVNQYGFDRDNIFYIAGNLIQIRSNPAVQYMLAGVYVNPDVTEANYSSWVADNIPFAIIYDAARRIQADIGNREAAGDMQSLYSEELSSLLIMSDDMPGE